MASVKASRALHCTITPKVHMMIKHIKWQMTNIKGGLGDKMEDWVERQHQNGMQMRQRYRSVQNLVVRATAQEKVQSRNSHPDVIAKLEAINEVSKCKFIASSEKKDDLL